MRASAAQQDHPVERNPRRWQRLDQNRGQQTYLVPSLPLVGHKCPKKWIHGCPSACNDLRFLKWAKKIRCDGLSCREYESTLSYPRRITRRDLLVQKGDVLTPHHLHYIKIEAGKKQKPKKVVGIPKFPKVLKKITEKFKNCTKKQL